MIAEAATATKGSAIGNMGNRMEAMGIAAAASMGSTGSMSGIDTIVREGEGAGEGVMITEILGALAAGNPR